MTKHKNAILFIIAILLFAYAGLISIVPTVLSKSFNIPDFEKKVEKETGLVTKIGKIDYQIKPNLNMIISISDWSSKYIDNQDCFDANYIEITTNPTSIFTKNFEIKDMFLNDVVFANQVLPEGFNKLAYLPQNFTGNSFGSQKVTVVSGPVRVKGFMKKDIAPGYYKEDYRNDVNYTKAEVKSFLQKLQFKNVIVK